MKNTQQRKKTQKSPKTKHTKSFFYKIALKQKWKKCITFEPIKIQTHAVPQNDRLNISFVKDIYVDG